MRTEHDLDLAPAAADRLRLLLGERADVADDVAPPVGVIVGRSRRVRRRRRATIAAGCLALVAVLVVGALGVERGPTPATVVTDVADEPGTDGAVATVGPPTGIVVPFQLPATERPRGEPLRLGLDIAGATVIGANDVRQQDFGAFRVRHSQVVLATADGGRLTVTVASEPDETGSWERSTAGPDHVILPGGRRASLNDWSPYEPGRVPPPILLYGTVDGDLPLVVDGAGVTREDVIAVASSVAVTEDRSAVVLGDLPDGFERVVSDPTTNRQNEVTYLLPDGVRATIGIALEPTSGELADLRLAADGPGGAVSPLPVRSTEAAVRRFEEGGEREVTVTWIEPTGHVVRLWLRIPVGVAEPDPASVAASIVPLDESTFQGFSPNQEAPGGS